jgi:hypothetical protein
VYQLALVLTQHQQQQQQLTGAGGGALGAAGCLPWLAVSPGPFGHPAQTKLKLSRTSAAAAQLSFARGSRQAAGIWQAGGSGFLFCNQKGRRVGLQARPCGFWPAGSHRPQGSGSRAARGAGQPGDKGTGEVEVRSPVVAGSRGRHWAQGLTREGACCHSPVTAKQAGRAFL